MKRAFIMTSAFDASWTAIGLTDADLAKLQHLLLLDPEAGAVIPGTGGARKVRVGAKGRGTRGGARVIYVDILVLDEIYLLAAYAKNEQTDMTEAQKATVRSFIKKLKE